MTDLMKALLSLRPTYVTTYISGAQKANSFSQLVTVLRGALIKNGPFVYPYNIITEL